MFLLNVGVLRITRHYNTQDHALRIYNKLLLKLLANVENISCSLYLMSCIILVIRVTCVEYKLSRPLLYIFSAYCFYLFFKAKCSQHLVSKSPMCYGACSEGPNITPTENRDQMIAFYRPISIVTFLNRKRQER